jgi:hypothetical protein
MADVADDLAVPTPTQVPRPNLGNVLDPFGYSVQRDGDVLNFTPKDPFDVTIPPKPCVGVRLDSPDNDNVIWTVAIVSPAAPSMQGARLMCTKTNTVDTYCNTYTAQTLSRDAPLSRAYSGDRVHLSVAVRFPVFSKHVRSEVTHEFFAGSFVVPETFQSWNGAAVVPMVVPTWDERAPLLLNIMFARSTELGGGPDGLSPLLWICHAEVMGQLEI